MITKLGLSLVLVTLAGLLNGPADACSNPINPTLSRSTIDTAAFHREFIVSGCADDVPPDGLPIVFGFHGGGESLHNQSGSGFLDFTNLSALHALVIVPVGNVSNNGHSWINAFPWMKPNPENDLLLPGALIKWIMGQRDLPRANLGRVYALGKSDGAGMSMALACNRDPRVNLVGVALVSGAYFGLESATNFGREDHQICLPESPVRMIMMHGTGDEVMPYPGQHFLNSKALEHADDYWTSIDPTAKLGPPRSSRTYTAGIARYVETLSSQVFHCAGFDERSFGSATTLAVGRGCDAPFHVLTITGGNHVWPGHAMSGPDSGQPPNMDFDATAEIARFFSIPMSGGRLTNTHDFNGDGISDILFENTTGGLAMWLMNSSAGIGSALGVGSIPAVWTVVGQRDLNGDGRADILFRVTDGSIADWLMNGATIMAANGLGNPGTTWNIVGTGDFSGDGIGDILLSGPGNAVAIWFMNSSGTVASAAGVGSLPAGWVVAGTGDFNGDGVWDILWYYQPSGAVAVWLMNSNGTIKSAVGLGTLPVGTWSIAGTGDFNGDGISDILLSASGNAVGIWFMNNSGAVASAQGVGTMASGWTVAQTGDYNGDGMSDILCYHAASGSIGAWLMNGASIASAVGIGSLPPASWTLVTANSD